MRDFNLYNLQLSDIELFLNVAKLGSFTKAGEKLFMTQSWVSKRISQIEADLDLNLFIRNKREVSLTPAGRVLEARFSTVTDDILDAIQAAHVAQTGVAGSLRVGYLEWGNSTVLEYVRKFDESNPQFSVEAFRQNFAELRNDISTGRIDLIFTVSYDCDQFSPENYNTLELLEIPVVAYMNKRHPLSGADELNMMDLRAQPMLMVDQKSSTGYGKFVRDLFIKYGIKPIISQYAHNGGEHIGSLLINKGVLIASQYFLENSFADEISRVIIEGETVNICAVWRRTNSNPALLKFVKMLKQMPIPEDLI